MAPQLDKQAGRSVLDTVRTRSLWRAPPFCLGVLWERHCPWSPHLPSPELGVEEAAKGPAGVPLESGQKAWPQLLLPELPSPHSIFLSCRSSGLGPGTPF